MYKVLLGLGTNLGDKIQNLEEAIRHIKFQIGEITKISSIYETQAWGVVEQDNYYNLVLLTKTELQPFGLLSKVLEIEKEMGRVREKKWDSRVIDIDIIFYENYILSCDKLHIPHPYITIRNFVLEPLNEIASDFIHPKLRQATSVLLANSKDQSWIRKLEFKPPPEL
ncbi:MAG TPA: 2-amino-4-hydroxy-6-hydroxymethyldihydropteridine diphosphokinase [Leadbetterella sp.]|nr:2-amino-4-hydroxy-6-hydroxymethyldihydropteridine diphosphokinase [Leadbetterella sp.]